MERASGKGDDLRIKWGSYYWVDVIPAKYFTRECKEKEISHRSIRPIKKGGKGSKETIDKAKLSVVGSTATLDYIGMNPSNNLVIPGIVTIHFTDKSRKEVSRIDWQDKKGKEYKNEASSNWHVFEEVMEGKRYKAEVERLQRDPGLVKRRKQKDKFTCQACGYLMKVGNRYIAECHHIEPLSDPDRAKITRIGDVVTLCPNCHRIAHTETPPLLVTEIKKIVTDNK